ncbi:caspase family protein [uncultured Aquimarina sp.]|uniref:caspase family protein n=1 Tax=uncultured Aquimarina sp. TaxID=575652 RepID=UPI0026070E27|nr:caspase family protein [uncultured Aquimarina sp.]
MDLSIILTALSFKSQFRKILLIISLITIKWGYSQSEEQIISQLIDMKTPQIQSNYLQSAILNPGRPHFQNKLMVITHGTILEIWNIQEKKKLHNINFENEIGAFLSKDESYILLLEAKSGNGSFSIGKINLQSGKYSRQWYSYDLRLKNWYAATATFIQDPEDNNKWVGIGTKGEIVSVNLNSFEIQNIQNEENVRTDFRVEARLIDNTNEVLLTYRQFKTPYDLVAVNNAKIYNFQSDRTQDILLPEHNEIFPLSNGNLIFRKDKSLFVYNLKSKSKYLVTNILENQLLENALVSNNKYLVVLRTTMSIKENEILTLNKDNFELISKKKYEGGNSYGAKNNKIYFYDSFRFYEISISNIKDLMGDKITFPNLNRKSVFAVENNVRVRSDGLIMLLKTYLYDLKNLQLKKVFNTYNTQFLTSKGIVMLKQVDGTGNNIEISLETYDNPLNSKPSKSKTFRLSYVPIFYKLSRSENFICAYSREKLNEIYLFNHAENTLKTFMVDKWKEFGVQNVELSSDDKTLIIYRYKNALNDSHLIQHYDLESGQLIREVYQNDNRYKRNSDFGDLHYKFDFSETYLLFHSKPNQLKLTDKITGSVHYYLSGKNLTHGRLLDYKQLILGYSTNDGFVQFWKKNQSVPEVIEIGIGPISEVREVDNKLFVFSNSGQIALINLDTLKIETFINIFAKGSEMISLMFRTVNNHFYSSKRDLRQFYFVKGLSTYSLLNYEIFLNRPDIILERLGFSDQTTIDIYKKAYQKRLRRNGLSEEIDILSLPIPEIQLINSNELSSSSKTGDVQVKLKHSSGAKIITIYVNGVPISIIETTQGKNIIEQTFKLSKGKNNISIVAKNKNSVESDPISFEIVNTKTKQKNKTYFVGIGVSKYQDSTMNLKYADKDVVSLTKLFKQQYGQNLVVDTLTNASVTKTNLARIKDKLLKTDIDDTVIISFSGHGLIDDNLSFYFAPHDMDFSYPSLYGISYEEMQDLMTGIPARKKLMLIDACHSGELDNEQDLKNIVVTNENVTAILPRGVKGSIAVGNNKSRNLQSSFELMQSLFYDLDRGNGSYVISAAGGLEFAYEDRQWKNGAFTYSVIQGFKELGRTRYGNDGIITISEFKNYVENKVQLLTNGHQKPTSRTENIEWDWRLK